MAANPASNGDAVDISVALSPSDLGSVPSLLSEIHSLGTGRPHNNHNGRLQLLEKAKALVRALETPRETVVRHTRVEPTTLSIVNFGVETGLWTTMLRNGSRPQKATELAQQLGVDPALLQRFMRHMGAVGYLLETGPDEYRSTNFTKALSLPNIADAYPASLWSSVPSLAQLHKYLQNTGFKNPGAVPDGPYQFAHNTTMTYFGQVRSDPHIDQMLDNWVEGDQQGRRSWVNADFYNIHGDLIDGFDASIKEGVFLVDIGGSNGRNIEELRFAFPKVPGRLVLQDIPSVIDRLRDLPDYVETMRYDFFTEQPVKGARAYFMRSILHNWPDEKCVEIVQRVRDAMKPEYSRFLIYEILVPTTGADAEITSMDIVMMARVGSKERTKREWADLLVRRCGLRICKIWMVPNCVDCVIECRLP